MIWAAVADSCDGRPPLRHVVRRLIEVDESNRWPFRYLPMALCRTCLQMLFDDAVALAGRSGVVVEKADSVDWLADKLRPRPDTDAYTVVWHSLFWGFLDPAAQESIKRLLDGAARRMRLATVRFEPEVLPGTPRLHVELYS